MTQNLDHYLGWAEHLQGTRLSVIPVKVEWQLCSCIDCCLFTGSVKCTTDKKMWHLNTCENIWKTNQLVELFQQSWVIRYFDVYICSRIKVLMANLNHKWKPYEQNWFLQGLILLQSLFLLRKNVLLYLRSVKAHIGLFTF